jgi:TRAP transporter 4TM/12TM fusion protein
MPEAREGRSFIELVLQILAVLAVIYHLLSAHFLIASANRHMNIHLAFALVITFVAALRKTRGRILNYVLLFAALGSTLWVHFNIDYLELHAGFPNQPIQVLIVAAILMLIILEGVRRAFGWTLTIVILIFIVYPYIGRWLPGSFRVPPINPTTILFRQTIGSMGTGGIYGNLLQMSVTAIFLFIVFGGLLQSTGATKFVQEVGKAAGRRLSGGVGLTAVVSSCLLGTITGAIAANIAATGSFTIPLMKKAGYRSSQAAAIEAMASTGGMIMPPVMGYVAFLMIAMIGIPYFELCLTTAIPALLYYFCGGTLRAIRSGQVGFEK